MSKKKEKEKITVIENPEPTEYQKNLSKYFENFTKEEKEDIEHCHFTIMSETMGYTTIFDFNVLHKIKHYRQRGLMFADIIEVVKRNVGFKYHILTSYEFYNLFEPAESFIHQAKEIKRNRDEFTSKNKKLLYQGMTTNINKEKELF